ncbi:S8 family serine peptidase [Phytohabitans suffuscus]|uniref:Type VII secretion-associated serine protease n=1 Tax=Phytohabitans suffuscus TaxID=624315 RepID=A0A6F8YP73_9ACTN|nr:S8 family serine peptidase [Phytohabitans suffuscus]BCB87920.1 type VII secretion-associated serine protease [Phytohabitans suffuscus]
MSRFARTTAVACVAAAMCAAGAVPAAAAPRAPANQRCAEPGPTVSEVPWAQRMLGPERVRPFTRGGNFVVAVLDSGVDAGHPQLGGRVLAGFDAVAGSGPADDDCLGTGTQIAGVIGARQEQSVGFIGLAPDVTILPIRVIAERIGSGNGAEPQVLARGIDEAVERGASVIAVTTITYSDSPVLQGAVANAISKGVVVVAAAGDLGDQRGAIPPPYPAAYDGVVGVGAIRESGVLWGKSQQGEYVDVVAPGENVLTLSRAGGMAVANGTAVATGFVAATAVLVRSRRGVMDGQGGIGRQIERTAVPSPGGSGYGSGVVDPYAAVTARLAAVSPEPLPDLPALSSGESPAWARARDVAMIGTAIAVAAVLVVLVFAVVMPRGRRRFWRTAVAPAPTQEAEPEEPGPPVQLFP